MNRRLSDHAIQVLRFYIGGNAVVAWHNAISDPRALLYRIAQGDDGGALIWIMALLGMAVAVDVLINDVMPPKYHWRFAIKYRHFLLCGLAFTYVAQLYVGVMAHQMVALLIYYLWNAGAILLATFLDAKLRSRNPQCRVLTFN